MRTDGVSVTDWEAAYDARPWLEQYPADISAHLDYPPESIWELLESTALRHAKKTAFIFNDTTMTYGELRAASIRMSQALAQAGVRTGDVVMVMLPNVLHFPVTYYAVLRLGAIVAAAPPNAVEREIENMLRDCGARAVVTIDLLYDRVANVWQRNGVNAMVVGAVTDFMPTWKRILARIARRVPTPKNPVPYGPIVQSWSGFSRQGGEVPAAATKPDDIALLQYTGGTTGLPKGAMLTHGSLLSNARQMKGWFPQLQDGRETILAVLPFFHVYGITLVMNAGLLLAARTVLVPRPILADIFKAIGKYRPTVFPGVPTLYVAIINDKRAEEYDLSSIDVCVSGGAPLPEEVKRDFERMTRGHLYEGYGLSEASPLTHAEPHDGRSKVGSTGIPVADTDAKIVDSSGLPVPIGHDGELLVRGPQLMRGYWGRPEETADVFWDGWLRTGDIARMDEQGWFSIVDRKNDLIITAGENIYPREVEEALFEHPAIKEVAVVGVPHPYGGEIAKAFVVLREGQVASKKDILQFAGQRLAKYKVPRAIEFRTELPKSAAQKTLRRVLAEEERERQASLPVRKARAAPLDDA